MSMLTPAPVANISFPARVSPLNVGVLVVVWVHRQFTMATMSLSIYVAEFVSLLFLRWRMVCSLWSAMMVTNSGYGVSVRSDEGSRR